MEALGCADHSRRVAWTRPAPLGGARARDMKAVDTSARYRTARGEGRRTSAVRSSRLDPRSRARNFLLLGTIGFSSRAANGLDVDPRSTSSRSRRVVPLLSRASRVGRHHVRILSQRHSQACADPRIPIPIAPRRCRLLAPHDVALDGSARHRDAVAAESISLFSRSTTLRLTSQA